jgi:hypothetical protein
MDAPLPGDRNPVLTDPEWGRLVDHGTGDAGFDLLRCQSASTQAGADQGLVAEHRRSPSLIAFCQPSRPFSRMARKCRGVPEGLASRS